MYIYIYRNLKHIYICTCTDAWMPQKRKHKRNFGTVDRRPQSIPRLHQNCEDINKYIYIYT